MSRFHGFDGLRVFAMAAVIYVHGCDTNPIAKLVTSLLSFPVPCFLLISAFLTQWAMFEKQRTSRKWIERKLKRLAPPFFAWSTIYLVVRYAKAFATGQEVDSTLLGCLFWGDASHQLYFVPLLAYCSVFWILPMQLVPRHTAVLSVLCILGICTSLLIEQPLNASLADNRYFIAKNLVWFPIGMLLAIAMHRLANQRFKLFWPAVVVLIFFLISGTWSVYALTISMFLVACAVKAPSPKIVQDLAAISFGVYLSHVLLIESIQFFAQRLGVDLASLPITLGIILIASIGSIGLCLGLDRSSKTRWLVR